MYCEKCGNQVDSNNRFCGKCGNQLNKREGGKNSSGIIGKLQRKGKRFWIGLGSVVVPVILIIFIILLFNTSPNKKIIGNTSLDKKIIGEWSTKQGMDSRIIEFRENGDLLYNDFGSHRAYTFKIKGKTLLVRRDDSWSEYEYSKEAINDTDYWYIKGDTLYLWRRKWYR